MNKKILLFSILLLLTIALAACLPASRVSAATLELDCDSQTGCDFCDFIALTAKISKFILGITGSLALLFFVIGGVILLTSQGNAENVETGKKMLLGSVIGVVIIFLAWTIVNFTILTLTGKLKEGKIAEVFGQPWNQIECVKPPPPPPTPAEEVKPGEGIKGCASSWEGGPSCGGNCGGIETAGIKEDQCYDASSDLSRLLLCLKSFQSTYLGKLGENNKLTITSVSDDVGLSNCRDKRLSSCSHLLSPLSCHYGGPHKYTNGSYAADFRKYGGDEYYVQLQSLVLSCRGQFWPEGDHYHISAPECGGT